MPLRLEVGGQQTLFSVSCTEVVRLLLYPSTHRTALVSVLMQSGERFKGRTGPLSIDHGGKRDKDENGAGGIYRCPCVEGVPRTISSHVGRATGECRRWKAEAYAVHVRVRESGAG